MTTRCGRKPLGPELVSRLAGSEHAKARLKTMLETLGQEKSVPEACETLQIGESRFHALRLDALQAALDRLEPQGVELEARLREVELERQALQVQLDLAHIRAMRGAQPAGSSKKPHGVS
jgi:hypothetical protein